MKMTRRFPFFGQFIHTTGWQQKCVKEVPFQVKVYKGVSFLSKMAYKGLGPWVQHPDIKLYSTFWASNYKVQVKTRESVSWDFICSLLHTTKGGGVVWTLEASGPSPTTRSTTSLFFNYTMYLALHTSQQKSSNRQTSEDNQRLCQESTRLFLCEPGNPIFINFTVECQLISSMDGCRINTPSISRLTLN